MTLLSQQYCERGWGGVAELQDNFVHLLTWELTRMVNITGYTMTHTFDYRESSERRLSDPAANQPIQLMNTNSPNQTTEGL